MIATEAGISEEGEHEAGIATPTELEGVGQFDFDGARFGSAFQGNVENGATEFAIDGNGGRAAGLSSGMFENAAFDGGDDSLFAAVAPGFEFAETDAGDGIAKTARIESIGAIGAERLEGVSGEALKVILTAAQVEAE